MAIKNTGQFKGLSKRAMLLFLGVVLVFSTLSSLLFLQNEGSAFAYDDSEGANNEGDTIFKGNFIDRTRIKSGDIILEDADPYDAEHRYVYKHDGCEDRLIIDGDSFKRGNGNTEGDSRNELYGHLFIAKSVNQGCEDEATSTLNNFIINNTGMRQILAYQINETVFWMPNAASYTDDLFGTGEPGDPVGPRKFEKEQESDDYWYWVDDDGDINQYDDGGVRISIEIPGRTIKYQRQLNSCDAGCTGEQDAKDDDWDKRLGYTTQQPNRDVYPDAPGEDGEGGVDPGDGEATDALESSCALLSFDVLNWILCPVYELLEGGATQMAGIMQGMLDYTVDEGAKDAWRNFRTIANILFVLALLVLIIAQAVGGKM